MYTLLKDGSKIQFNVCAKKCIRESSNRKWHFFVWSLKEMQDKHFTARFSPIRKAIIDTNVALPLTPQSCILGDLHDFTDTSTKDKMYSLSLKKYNNYLHVLQECEEEIKLIHVDFCIIFQNLCFWKWKNWLQKT